jgi:hypothetical protein
MALGGLTIMPIKTNLDSQTYLYMGKYYGPGETVIIDRSLTDQNLFAQTIFESLARKHKRITGLTLRGEEVEGDQYPLIDSE